MADRHQFRANWHDYNGGIYFVTVCTHGRRHSLGSITNGEMHLSELGKITDRCINELERHHPDVSLLNYVVMPNHIHLAIDISPGASTMPSTAPSPAVRTRYIASLRAPNPESNSANSAPNPESASNSAPNPNSESNSAPNSAPSQKLGCLKPTTHGDTCTDFHHNCRLASVIGSLKAAITRAANRVTYGRDISRPKCPKWQQRYYENIIRNERSFVNIMNYIDNNVIRWDNDCMNK